MKEVNWDKIEELIEEIAKEAEIDLDEAGSITILKDGHTQRIYIGVAVPKEFILALKCFLSMKNMVS